MAPVLTEFKRFYPDIYPQLFLGAEVTDIIAKEVDVAIRIWNGPMPDSSLSSRRLGSMPTGLYAAPSYLESYGEPTHPSQLKDHACLVSQLYMGRDDPAWPLFKEGERKEYAIRPVAAATDPEGLHGFLLAGQGIQLTNHMRVKADVSAGRLRRVLTDWVGPEPSLYAVRTGGRLMPPRLRVFLDFLQPRIDLTRTGEEELRAIIPGADDVR
ncbi:substrate binding domain-containing protein [Rhizobium sp. RCAM05350]|nr:substrate binding domain-containing protein [Rhizobium sp. RCAM05350]